VNCDNEQNLCGEFQQPCKAVGPVSVGLQIWTRSVFEFWPNSTYRRVDHASFDQTACKSGNAWIEVTHEGDWNVAGGSETVLGKDRASKTVKNAWIRLIQERPCITPTGGLEASRCFDGLEALKGACPCNGWDWTSYEGRGRNIGMFCQPALECSILHEVFLQQTQLFSFNASEAQACFSKANTAQARGWDKPEDDACLDKTSKLNCASTSAMSPASSTLVSPHTALLSFLLLMLGFR